MKKLIACILVLLITATPVTAGAEEWDMSVPTEITEEIRSAFEKATENLDGVDYIPVAVLGMQDNICCILCKATAVYPEAKPYNVLVYLNGTEIQNVYELWIDKHAEKEILAHGTSNCA